MADLRNWLQDLLGIQFVYIAGVLQPSSDSVDFLNATGAYNPATGRVEVNLTASANATQIRGVPVDDSAQTTSPATFAHLEYSGTEWIAVSNLTIATSSHVNFGGPVDIRRAGETRFLSGTTTTAITYPSAGDFELYEGPGNLGLRFTGDSLRFGDLISAGSNILIGFVSTPTTEAGRNLRVQAQSINHASLAAGNMIYAAGRNFGAGASGFHLWEIHSADHAKLYRASGNITRFDLYDTVAAGTVIYTANQQAGSVAGTGVVFSGGDGGLTGNQNGGIGYLRGGLKTGSGTDGNGGIADTALALRLYVRGSDKFPIIDAPSGGSILVKVNTTDEYTFSASKLLYASGNYTDYGGEIDMRRQDSTSHRILSTSTQMQYHAPTNGQHRWFFNSVEAIALTTFGGATGPAFLINGDFSSTLGASLTISQRTTANNGMDFQLKAGQGGNDGGSRVGGAIFIDAGAGAGGGAGGDGRLRTGAAAARVHWNDTGVGINGQTPAARPDYTITNPTTNRSIDVSGINLTNLAQVVGTIIQDFINIGWFQ